MIFDEKFFFWSNFFVRFSVGEAAGKAPLGVAKKEDVNINQLRGKADSAMGVVSDTRMVKEKAIRIEKSKKTFSSQNFRN